jgi:ribosomal protein S18 acetylase RimI-like enzyme
VNGEIMGFVTFRHRMRDLQTTLSDLCVDESYRKHGIGRFLIDTLFEESTQKGRSFILLKCPQDLESNAFYEHIGFVLERIEAGKSRKLKVWRLNIQRDKLN